jgi:hypothetical protein
VSACLQILGCSLQWGNSPVLWQDEGYLGAAGGLSGADRDFTSSWDVHTSRSSDGLEDKIDQDQLARQRASGCLSGYLVEHLEGRIQWLSPFLCLGNQSVDETRTFPAQGFVEFHQIYHDRCRDAALVDVGCNKQLSQAGRVDRAPGDQAEQRLLVAREADCLLSVLDSDTDQGRLRDTMVLVNFI